MIRKVFMRNEAKFSFDAKGMRKLAIAEESQTENYEYDQVADKIMEAAGNGQLSIKIAPTISDSTTEELSQLGFNVDRRGDYYTEISW